VIGTRLYLQDSIESGSLLIKSDSRLSDSSLSNTKDSVLNVLIFVASKCKHIIIFVITRNTIGFANKLQERTDYLRVGHRTAGTNHREAADHHRTGSTELPTT